MSAAEATIGEATPAGSLGAPRARMMLQRARWAAGAFARYDRDQTRSIVEAVAAVAHENAERFAAAAVEETGMGVIEHKRRKNEACSRGVFERYADEDYVGMRVDPERKLVEIPKPAGVILALTPSTNPIATVYFNVLLALMTRSVVVVAPHPMARKVSVEAVRAMARAAVAAGAPDGCLQVVEEPTVPLIEILMADAGTDLILATGGNAVVSAAYRSGTPSLEVGHGNVPAFVDATADIARAAACLAESKSFDNSVLCTNESTVIAEERIADALVYEFGRQGAHVLDRESAGRVRAACYPDGQIDVALAGKDATVLAKAAGIKVPGGTRALVAPFPLIVPEETLAHKKLFPLLGMVRVRDVQRGIDAARALLRIGGAGHSAVIHSRAPATILAYGAAMGVLRVSVNAPGSTDSLTEILQPRDLVRWTQVAYAADPSEPFGDFTGLDPWTPPATAAPLPHEH